MFEEMFTLTVWSMLKHAIFAKVEMYSNTITLNVNLGFVGNQF